MLDHLNAIGGWFAINPRGRFRGSRGVPMLPPLGVPVVPNTFSEAFGTPLIVESYKRGISVSYIRATPYIHRLPGGCRKHKIVSAQIYRQGSRFAALIGFEILID